MVNYWLEDLISSPREFIDKFYPQGKYYQKIRKWHLSNQKRKKPRTCLVFTLDKEDSDKNATFSTFQLGIKNHIISRAYLNKITSFIPPSPFRETIFKLSGIVIEENVFIAPDVTIDPLLRGWTRFRKGSSIGWGTKFFNHLFEENGRVILGYIDICEDVSIGGFVSVSPGVTIGKKTNISAEVKIGPGVSIGNHVKIGAGSLIGPFITIGDGAEVLIGSIVLENVKPYSKVSGNPAKVIAEKENKDKPKLDLIINPNIEKNSEKGNLAN